MIQSSTKYSVNAYCLNCHFRGTVAIIKGVSVKGEFCPECGCMTLEKDLKANPRKEVDDNE